MPSGFVFGQHAPCRACHGEGQRVVKMSTEEKREHDRQNRALRARGQDTDRMPAKKACPDCEGRGYVEIAVADGTAKKENKA